MQDADLRTLAQFLALAGRMIGSIGGSIGPSLSPRDAPQKANFMLDVTGLRNAVLPSVFGYCFVPCTSFPTSGWRFVITAGSPFASSAVIASRDLRTSSRVAFTIGSLVLPACC
jgi:hypothetical protein